MRRTPQRDAIIRFLDNNHGHPSAGEIFDAVKPSMPGLSFATVYNTVERLRETGKLREITLDPKRRRFDPNPKLHHHIVCIRCGEIRDVHGEYGVNGQDKDIEGYEVVEAQIEFFGVCPKCREGR